MTYDDGGPAFPVEDKMENFSGMTLRDYFAAKALQGVLAYSGPNDEHWDDFASCAYQMADEMLAARAKGGQGE